MITFEENICMDRTGACDAIFFDRYDKPRIVQVLERALNTLSPPDQELIELLRVMKK